MSLRNLTLVAAIATLAAAPAFAQHEPGAGAPSSPDGAPTPPNASIAPSMIPNGGNQGTRASAMTNVGVQSADQGPGAQTPQPGMRHGHGHARRNSSMGSGSSSTGSLTTPPTR